MPLIFVMLGVVMPLCGVIWLGWSVGTLVAVLAVENWLALGLMGLRIRRHEQLTSDPLHHRPEIYSRFGKWTMPSPRGRFLLDYGVQSLVAGLGLVLICVMVPYLYVAKHPLMAAPMLPQWDDVALGAAVATVCSLIEVPVVLRQTRGDSFSLMQDAAMRRYMIVVGCIVIVMTTPMLANVWNNPLVLLLGVIAVKTTMDWMARTGPHRR
ncbi:MAG: DUF6498-containing protein [Pseudomarimonas sp.]